jgi:anhydro-N-acetylmuramic acid kinase
VQDLQRRIETGEAVIGGVLSGTSGDGIDVALCSLSRQGPPRVLAARMLPWPEELLGRVRAVLDGEPLDLRGSALLSRDLGLAFGRAARQVADGAGLALDLLGSHGLTVWHHDGCEPSGPATLQLGDGDFVAEAAGCTVVSDFRPRDCAAGGEGAPLTALCDGELFPSLGRPACVLNLGGISNLTFLGPGDAVLSAFDAGPAGALLDGLARRLLRRPFDGDGAAAAAGRPDEGLLAEFLEHPFLARRPPRSTGRDTFGQAWVEHFLARGQARAGGGARTADLLASGVAFVAECIARALARFAPSLPGSPQPTRIVAAGGGTRNRTLMAALAARTGLPVESSSSHGVDPDLREAVAFAVLARRCLSGSPSTQTAANGALPGRPLGKISLHLG